MLNIDFCGTENYITHFRNKKHKVTSVIEGDFAQNASSLLPVTTV